MGRTGIRISKDPAPACSSLWAATPPALKINANATVLGIRDILIGLLFR
jgi:hypothetical protein